MSVIVVRYKVISNDFFFEEPTLQMVYKYFYEMLLEVCTYKQTIVLIYAAMF